MNTEGARFAGVPQPRTEAEQWILARLDKVTAETHAHYANYRFDLLAQSLYEFAWNAFCDWFVELAKPALNGQDSEAAASTRHTLLYVLEALLRLLRRSPHSSPKNCGSRSHRAWASPPPRSRCRHSRRPAISIPPATPAQRPMSNG